MLFKGSGVALITPFDKNMNINYEKLEELINFHITNSTDAIIICGTTGESATLNEKEKKDIIKFTVNKVNHRIPVIAGSGTNCTSSTIEMSKYAKSIGADGILVVTPYYNKCSQKGLYLHYKKLANSVDIPIILYNVPSRTGVNIDLDTVIKLSEIRNIVGIKEASGNISQVTDISNNTPTDFAIYSGNDDQILPILSIGGCGVISVLANVYSKDVHNICKYFFDNDLKSSKYIQLKYLELIHCLFSDINPIPIKCAMNILDYNVGDCRLPLCKMDIKKRKNLEIALKKITN